MGRISALLASLSLGTASLVAQSTGPAPRPLGPVVATSPATFQRIRNVVGLSDGRALVNDILAGTISVVNPALAVVRVTRDSAHRPPNNSNLSQGLDNQYGAHLIPFDGDSTLLWNFALRETIVVLDPQGHVARTIAAPAPDVAAFGLTPGLPLPPVAYSTALGLVYTGRVPAPRQIPMTAERRRAPGQPDSTVVQDDSLMVLTMNLRTRASETLTRLATGQLVSYTFMSQSSSGGGRGGSVPVPLPLGDVMRMMQDGSLAVLRGRSYHVDWLTAGSARSASPRLSYEWQRVTDDERARLADSIGAPARARYDSTLAKWIADSAAGTPQMDTANRLLPGAARGAGGDMARVREISPRPRPRPPTPVDPGVIPDYLPAFRMDRLANPGQPSMMFADAENRLWIQPIRRGASPDSGAVFDVVDRSGRLVERVSLPPGRAIVGFGPGHVFLAFFDGGTHRLEKARLR